MALKSLGKLRHLSVVRDSPLVSEGRIMSAENFTADQARLTSRYHLGAALSGVVVGALLGEAAWDVRPLILDGGELYLLRLSDPGLILHPTRHAHLRKCMASVRDIAGFRSGEIDGQFWVRRPFYQFIAATPSSLEEGGILHPVHMAQQLLRHMQHLASLLCAHGHIVPSNIALTNEGTVVVDHFFSSFSVKPQAADLAPEILGGGEPNTASDVYGLGLTLRTFLGKEMPFEFLNVVEKMTVSDPHARPTLANIETLLFPQRTPTATPAPGVIPQPRSTVRSGKVIAPKQTGVLDREAEAAALPHTPSPEALAVQPIAAVAAEERRAPSEASNRWFAALVALIAVAGIGFGAHRLGLFARSAPSEVEYSSFQSYWGSNQPSLMQRVARAAVFDQDESAQYVIVRAALQGQAHPLVRAHLLGFAFHSLWEADLSPEDRRIALALGTSKLLGSLPSDLPALAAAHPAVILAVLGDLHDLLQEETSPDIAVIPLAKMRTLPSPFKEPFAALEQMGVASMGHREARALAHILVGDLQKHVFESYFAESDDLKRAAAKAALLFPLMQQSRVLAEQLFSYLNISSSPLAPLARWFGEEAPQEVVPWDKSSHQDRLRLMLGQPPQQGLSFEQYADLLLYPRSEIRAAAESTLIRLLPAAQRTTVSFLASNGNKLSRAQSILLVTALRHREDTSSTFLAQWLVTRPDVPTVLQLLLARRDRNSGDQTNLELARYVRRSRWDAPFEVLKQLAIHPEALVRALAYSKLRVDDQTMRAVLEDAARVEPHRRLREGLQARLSGIPDSGSEANGDDLFVEIPLE